MSITSYSRLGSGHDRRFHPLSSVLWSLLPLFLISASFSTTTCVCHAARTRTVVTYASANGDDAAKKMRMAISKGITPDPFVVAAPLAIAVVCKDGILFMSTENDTVEDDESDEQEDDDGASLSLSLDVTANHQERPSRIHKIDAIGTTLVTAGWRVDGERLARRCRAIAAGNAQWMGSIDSNTAASSSSSLVPPGYPFFLAQETSLWMAKCAVLGSVRGLSTVGLLACGSGHLFLVDATGFYPIRAHAIGKGATRINPALRSNTNDWQSMSCREAEPILYALLADPPMTTTAVSLKGGSSQDGAAAPAAVHQESTRDGTDPGWHLSAGKSLVETACISFEEKGLERAGRRRL